MFAPWADAALRDLHNASGSGQATAVALMARPPAAAPSLLWSAWAVIPKVNPGPFVLKMR